MCKHFSVYCIMNGSLLQICLTKFLLSFKLAVKRNKTKPQLSISTFDQLTPRACHMQTILCHNLRHVYDNNQNLARFIVSQRENFLKKYYRNVRIKKLQHIAVKNIKQLTMSQRHPNGSTNCLSQTQLANKHTLKENKPSLPKVSITIVIFYAHQSPFSHLRN